MDTLGVRIYNFIGNIINVPVIYGEQSTVPNIEH